MNRQIWIADRLDGKFEFIVGPFVVLSLKQFLPAGPIRDPVTKKRTGNERKLSLLQIWTDGGLRTVSVASVWGRNPQQNDSQW